MQSSLSQAAEPRPQASPAALLEPASPSDFPTPNLKPACVDTAAYYRHRVATQKHQYIMMESQVRRLSRKVAVEHELARNRKMLESLEKELERQEGEINELRRESIRKRLDALERNREERWKMIRDTNQEVARLKEKQVRKNQIIEKVLQSNKYEYQLCYERALQPRRKLMKPIDFDELAQHEKRYMKVRDPGFFKQSRRIKTQQEQQSSSHHHSRRSRQARKNSQTTNKLSKNHSPNEQQHNGSEHCEANKSSVVSRHMLKSSIDDYKQTRRREEKRLLQLKQILNRRKQYGNRVEKQYHRNRMKSEAVELRKLKQRIVTEQTHRQISDRNRLLQQIKKPELPFHFDLELGRKMEIAKIAKSSESPEEKIKRLSLLSEAELQRMEAKGGGSVDLERLRLINLARVKILLEGAD